jgi:cytochrome c-type biogenesis protein CcmH/NrfG
MIFQQVLAQDPENERAWLWMAAAAETPSDRVRYLNTVLQLNPHNTTAKKELERIQHRLESSNTQVIRYGLMGLGVFAVLVVCALLVLVIL